MCILACVDSIIMTSFELDMNAHDEPRQTFFVTVVILRVRPELELRTPCLSELSTNVTENNPTPDITRLRRPTTDPLIYNHIILSIVIAYRRLSIFSALHLRCPTVASTNNNHGRSSTEIVTDISGKKGQGDLSFRSNDGRISVPDRVHSVSKCQTQLIDTDRLSRAFN